VAAVQASTSTVTWPAVGALAQPTTLFLVPYRPATLDATVPCRAVRAALGRPAATTILATTTSEASTGLVIRSEPAVAGERPSELQVLVSGREVPVTVPAGDCTLRVVADAAGVRLTVGDPSRGPTLTRPGDPVPQVFAATTDLTGPDTAGLALTARTPSWFDNAPSPEKAGLVALQLQLAAAALILLVILGLLARPGPGPRTLVRSGTRERVGTARADVASATRRRVRGMVSAPRRPAALGRGAVDVVVALGLVWWSVVGPTTDDDGFAAVIARESVGGDVGNYYRWFNASETHYRWFNASETPFTAGQQVLSWFLDDGLSPVERRGCAARSGSGGVRGCRR